MSTASEIMEPMKLETQINQLAGRRYSRYLCPSPGRRPDQILGTPNGPKVIEPDGRTVAGPAGNITSSTPRKNHRPEACS